MESELAVNVAAQRSSSRVRILLPAPAEAPFLALLQRCVDAAVGLVAAQGLAVDGASASAEWVPLGAHQDRLEAQLTLENAHPSFWRVLLGRLMAFDVASTAILRFDVQGAAPAVEAARVLALAYPQPPAATDFDLDRTHPGDHSRSVEVLPSEPGAVEPLKALLANWLECCNGGFFASGSHPVTNAHDCPGPRSVGRGLVLARLNIFSGDEAAFDVLLRALASGAGGALRQVRIY